VAEAIEPEGQVMTGKALFELGQIVATPGALDLMERCHIDGLSLLARHVTGDWGDIDPEDRGLNEEALRDGSRIFSVYGKGAERCLVITEWDRSVTTILKPDEY